MVSQGRALAVAATWIIVPLVLGAWTFTRAFPERDGWNAVIPALGISAVVCLTPLALLTAAIWIARRADKARSVAVLGAQAGGIGLATAALAIAGFIASHW
ncbi:hypothetical protein ACTOB_003841 [Actinoplanes oblitus]|uniref:Uncharacterized protein n=1 Tax=Actinoplanes oblitus TaxID=3040509 RepID=A0ABY8WU14_9ACTN|nr:hypothetical protein [Actinoplanes oblitus]WIN00154.1 hypothetical protein ACTOB_003841 [Actinoplanes oblitus]